MTHSCARFKRTGIALVLLCTTLFSNGCATTKKRTTELPPILAQEELLRPYLKVGVIEVHRERYGSPEDFTSGDYTWGYQALRVEAARIGADAVILPEVKAERQTFIFFPSSEMKAKGIAIKFR
jgi:hypothetical protein